MNKVILIGNLGNEPELRVVGDGTSLLKFSLATTERWKGKDGERKDRTEWHRCVLFGKRAESLAKILKKGERVAVEGSVTYGSYDKDGVKTYTTDIKVFEVELLGGKKPTGDSAAEPESHVQEDIKDEDVPF